jgi:negative regulator of replication initiation
MGMRATVEIPEAVLRELEAMARREGATASDLIRRLVEAHVARSQPAVEHRLDVHLPLIPAAETGPIRPVTGADVDELFSRDHFSA